MTKQVTMNVGRKEYDEYDKKRNVTVRIYPADQILIKSKCGSFQKFVDDSISCLRDLDSITKSIRESKKPDIDH